MFPEERYRRIELTDGRLSAASGASVNINYRVAISTNDTTVSAGIRAALARPGLHSENAISFSLCALRRVTGRILIP